MPNSLIFVVILAVWAAYLIQHWIRRRDHVATAKSVDRFSEAMRVLERRQSMPRADLSTPAPRSYSVSLTRPAHPDVMVKRARHGAASGPQRRSGAPRGSRRLPRPSTAVLRGTALVLGALVLAAGLTLWSMGLVSWWAAAAGAAGLLLALTVVRVSVGTQRRRAASPVRATKQRATLEQERLPEVASLAQHTGAAPVEASGTRATELYDVEAFAAPITAFAEPIAPVADSGLAAAGHATATEGSVVAAETLPGTWAPVPVPPPTYTLKARASRSQPASNTRRQTPVMDIADLPFDGHALALDEEFEELPSVHRVG